MNNSENIELCAGIKTVNVMSVLNKVNNTHNVDENNKEPTLIYIKKILKRRGPMKKIPKTKMYISPYSEFDSKISELAQCINKSNCYIPYPNYRITFPNSLIYLLKYVNDFLTLILIPISEQIISLYQSKKNDSNVTNGESSLVNSVILFIFIFTIFTFVKNFVIFLCKNRIKCLLQYQVEQYLNKIHDINILFSSIMTTKDPYLTNTFIQAVKYQQALYKNILLFEENKIVNKLQICIIKNNLSKKSIVNQIKDFPIFHTIELLFHRYVFNKKLKVLEQRIHFLMNQVEEDNKSLFFINKLKETRYMYKYLKRLFLEIQVQKMNYSFRIGKLERITNVNKKIYQFILLRNEIIAKEYEINGYCQYLNKLIEQCKKEIGINKIR